MQGMLVDPNSEDKGNRFFRNFGSHTPNFTSLKMAQLISVCTAPQILYKGFVT